MFRKTLETVKSFLPLATVLATVLAGLLAAAPAVADEVERLVGLMDTSRLGPMTGVVIPGDSLAYNAKRALRPSSAGPALARETLQVLGLTPQRVFAASPGFTYELRKKRLAVLLLRREGVAPGEPVPGGEPALSEDALARLTDLGLPAGELALLDSRRLLYQDKDLEGPAGPPVIAGYKQFVERRLAGAPILGSRAVVSYERDYRFEKALVYWPSLAAEGHELESAMTPGEVALAVAKELVASGETDVTGSIPLRWVYDTAVDPDGRVRLQLRVEASLLEPESPLEDDDVEKIRVRLFAPAG